MKHRAIKYIFLFFVLTNCANKLDELSSNNNENQEPSVEIIQQQIPVLTLKEGNQVLLMKINAGNATTKIREINFDLTGSSDLEDLEHIKILYHGAYMQDSIQFGETMSPSRKICFKGKLSLPAGDSYFSVDVKLKATADIIH